MNLYSIFDSIVNVQWSVNNKIIRYNLKYYIVYPEYIDL